MSGAISATTLGIVAGVGAAGSIGGAVIGANAAGNAASTQANAADRAAQLQYQASQNALGFQEQQYAQNQANLQPWLQSGAGGLANLDYLLGVSPGGGFSQQPGGGQTPATGQAPGAALAGANPGGPAQLPGARPMSNLQPANFRTAGGSVPANGPPGPTVPVSGAGGASPGGTALPPASGPTGTVNPALGGFGSLMQPYQGQFTAPNALTEQNDPGYQARLQLGQLAMDKSAAARGSLLTGGTAQAENQAAQDYASNEYGNVYNRAFNTYAQGYNQYEQGQANQYNRLASLAGVGQQTAGQLGYLGNQSAQDISGNLLGTAAAMGQQYNNAAAANASGYVGAANAYGGALSGIGGNLQNLLLLQQMGGGGGLSNSAGDNGGYLG